MPEAEFNLLVWSLVEASAEPYRELVKRRLAYGNELSLRRRLRKLVDEFGSLFGEDKQKSALVGRVVDARNYYTHYDPNLEKASADGADLLLLCYRMEALFELCLLKELGFDEVTISTIAQENENLRQKLRWKPED